MDRYTTCPAYLIGRSCEVCDHEVEDHDEVAIDFDGEPHPDGGYIDHSRVQHWQCRACVLKAQLDVLGLAVDTPGAVLRAAIAWREHELAQEPHAA